jgi:hypothetical protein
MAVGDPIHRPLIDLSPSCGVSPRLLRIQDHQNDGVSADWFRSPSWDEASREDFEKRLRRARAHNRPQYLRIKALAVRDAGRIEVAKELLLRILDHPEVQAFEAAFAQEILGDIAVQQGEPELGERYYRQLLHDHHSLSGTTANVEIGLAEILLATSGSPRNHEAQQLLTSWISRPGLKFDNQLFRWHLALIHLSEQTGDHATVRQSAKTALELATRGPQLPHHRDLGLVQADEATLRRLRKLAR